VRLESHYVGNPWPKVIDTLSILAQSRVCLIVHKATQNTQARNLVLVKQSSSPESFAAPRVFEQLPSRVVAAAAWQELPSARASLVQLPLLNFFPPEPRRRCEKAGGGCKAVCLPSSESSTALRHSDQSDKQLPLFGARLCDGS